MDSKAIRTIVVFGILATMAMTVMMIFTLDQVADTQTPQIAADISREFARALAAEPPATVKLTMTREGKGEHSRRVYRMRIRPSAAVAAEETALKRLMYHVSELCAGALGDSRGEVEIRCVALLPDGREREAVYMKDKSNGDHGGELIHAVTTVATGSGAEAPKR